jgi:hypothetical protein
MGPTGEPARDPAGLRARLAETARKLKDIRASSLSDEDQTGLGYTNSPEDQAPESTGPSRRTTTGGADGGGTGPVVPNQDRTIATMNQNRIPTMPSVSARVPVRNLPIEGMKLVMRPELDFSEEHNRGLRSALGATVEDWDDTKLLGLKTFELRRYTNVEIIPKCDKLVKGLTQEMTEDTAKTIIQLAYNLRDTVPNKWVFKDTNPCEPELDQDTNFATRLMFSGSSAPYVRPTDISEDDYIMGCCFVAASTLRLFSKSAENYIKAFPQISEAYYRFYYDQFPLTGFSPDRKCIEGLKTIYTTRHVFRNALAPFLYEYSELKDPKGMCTLLYEQHLALTGMHAVSLYVKLCQFLNCRAEDLGSGLWHRSTKDAILEIKRIIINYRLSEDTNQKKQTWMYARLYSESYFATVQTKFCKSLVCAMAYMASQLGISGNQDVMNIVHIQRMTGIARETPIEWGEVLLYMIEHSDDAAEGNPVTAARKRNRE